MYTWIPFSAGVLTSIRTSGGKDLRGNFISHCGGFGRITCKEASSRLLTPKEGGVLTSYVF